MIEITNNIDFDIRKTFECGQCFRWNADENGVYTGVAFERALSLRQDGDTVSFFCSESEFNKVWRSYFDLDRDYAKIREQLCVSEFMKQATAFGKGIRILRQEPWEALCSFIISQNNNIPRIKSIIEKLCEMYGEPVQNPGGQSLYAFPSADKLSALTESDLASLRCGYRARYIINAAKAVSSGKLDLGTLSKLPPESTRAELKKLCGVGDKVADCTMLFGLHLLDAFPVDVWMKKALAQHFDADFDLAVFSPYAGIAQQYIFNYVRNGAFMQ